MNAKTPALSAFALSLFLSGCGPEEPAAAPEKPGATASEQAPAAAALIDKEALAAIWPEDDSKVYEEFDMMVGPEGTAVHGSLAIVLDKPVPAGTPVTASRTAQLLPAGQNHGVVNLPAGDHTIVVQALDAQGKSLGPDYAKTVHYKVVPGPENARVFFIEPLDGATVSTKFHVKFGVEGMGMSPALENVLDKTLGHHHILVNAGPMPPSVVIPADATHLHYGKAQTETDVELAPGEYTLTMQFADGNHRSYGRRLAATIRVKVTE
jgi:hypothetical protein